MPPQLQHTRLTSAMPVLPCTDLNGSIAHYRDVLRFHGGWHWLWGEPPTHAGLSRDQVHLMLHGDPAAAAKVRGLTCYFYARGSRRT